MKETKKRVTGQIVKGGLSMFMGELNEWFKLWHNNKVIVTFEVLRPEASEAIKGYYYKYIVPEFQRALKETGERKTEAQTEQFLRSLSPIMWDETPDIKTGKYCADLRGINDLTNPEMCEYIEHLRELAAVEFGFEVKDPNTF